MTTQFWLFAESVPLTLEQIASMTNEQARLFLAELRWGGREQQACPECGVIDRHYNPLAMAGMKPLDGSLSRGNPCRYVMCIRDIVAVGNKNPAAAGFWLAMEDLN